MTAKAARKAIRKGADWYMLRVEDSGQEGAEINLLDANHSIGVTGTGRDELMELLQTRTTRLLPKSFQPSYRLFARSTMTLSWNQDAFHQRGHRSDSPSQSLTSCIVNLMKCRVERGFIHPSKSPYGAPVFFVRKADVSLRMGCDWRQLNKITVKTQACLPSIDDLFDSVRGAKHFQRAGFKIRLQPSPSRGTRHTEDSHQHSFWTF